MNNPAIKSCQIIIEPSTFTQALTDIWPETSNAYAFALNKPELGMRVPGDLNKDRGAWLRTPPVNPPQHVREGLLRDGWAMAQDKDFSDDQAHIIAVSAHPYFYDFGVMCRDNNKTWWSKNAGAQPTNKWKGVPISDPQTVINLSGETFVGYFRMPKEGLPALIV